MRKKKENHNKEVMVRLTPNELEKLDSYRGKVSRGGYLRSLLNNSKPKVIPKSNLVYHGELVKIGNNINQISRHLNMGGSVNFNILTNEINDLRRLLIGIGENHDKQSH